MSAGGTFWSNGYMSNLLNICTVTVPFSHKNVLMKSKNRQDHGATS